MIGPRPPRGRGRRLPKRTRFTRGRVVVAELRGAGWLEWLEDRARSGRQGYMDPKQSEAFAEFLARQPPVGEQ